MTFAKVWMDGGGGYNNIPAFSSKKINTLIQMNLHICSSGL